MMQEEGELIPVISPRSGDMYWHADHIGEGGAGGYVVKNDLFKSLDEFKKRGLIPIGLIIDGWNIEVIVKKEWEDGRSYRDDKIRIEVQEGIC